MQSGMDNNDNPIIQGLEALLGSEDETEISFNQQSEGLGARCPDSFGLEASFSEDPGQIYLRKKIEEMRTRFRDSFSLDQSKDSGVFGNASSRQLFPSVNSSLQNQSTESGFGGDLYDNPFYRKRAVKHNISFDGCYIEDDFNPLAEDLTPRMNYGREVATHSTGILSSAVSHGGDLKKYPNSVNVKEAYMLVKYNYMMRKCWGSLLCTNKLRSQLINKKVQQLDNPMTLSLKFLMDTFRHEALQAITDLKESKLLPVLHELQNSYELISSNLTSQTVDVRALKQLKRLADNLFVAMYCFCVLQQSQSSPSEDHFRFQKCYQIWNSFA